MTHALPAPPADSPESPAGWVPVERRWLGLDRRSLLPGIVVAVVGVLLSGVFPLINDSVSWTDPIVAGDRVALGPEVVVTPPVGWQLVEGVRVGEPTVGAPGPTASLNDADVAMTLAAEPLPDGVDGLLTSITDDIGRSDRGAGFTAAGDPVHLTTDAGLTGATRRWSSTSSSGIVAVIAIPPSSGPGRPTAAVVQASGPGTTLDTVISEVDTTIRSVTRGGGR